jgi:hypothetical protein
MHSGDAPKSCKDKTLCTSTLSSDKRRLQKNGYALVRKVIGEVPVVVEAMVSDEISVQ